MEDSDLLPPVLARFHAKPQPDAADDDESVAPGNAFAVSRGVRPPTTLKFYRLHGHSLSLAYGYLPIPWWQSPDSLLIEYPGLFTVALTGRNLGELQAHLADYRITWIREGGPPSAAPLSAAVTRIDILRAYPSRETGRIIDDAGS